MELRAKMVELAEMVQSFRQLAEHQVAVQEFRDPMMTADTIRRVSFQYKAISPLFSVAFLKMPTGFILPVRKRPTACWNTISASVRRIGGRNYCPLSSRSRCCWSWAVSSFIAVGGFFPSGSVISRNWQPSNENLETMVQSRTRQLEQEISERRKTEVQLSEQARFLTTTIESLDHPFLVISVADSKVVMANSAARDLCDDWHHPTCYAHTQRLKESCVSGSPCTLERVKAEKQPVTIDYVHPNAEGETIYVEVHGYPIFNECGDLVHIIEYSLDVTEHKLAQQQLQGSQGSIGGARR